MCSNVSGYALFVFQRYGSYFQMRADLDANVEHQLSRLERSPGFGNGSATGNNRRKPTVAPVRSGKSKPVEGDSLNAEPRPARHGKPTKAVNQHQAAWTADRIKSHVTKKQETKVTISTSKNNTGAIVPRKTLAFTSTPVKSNNFFTKTSNDLHSPSTNICSDDEYELSSESVSAIEDAKDSFQKHASSTIVKSPRNMFSQSDNFLDASLKQFNEVSPRSVLKGAVSTGSLVAKKRVLFVDQDDSLPAAKSSQDDTPVAVRVDTRQSTRTIGLLGEGYDSDFDISRYVYLTVFTKRVYSQFKAMWREK